MRGQRGQWAGEGYIFSVLCSLTGLLLIFLFRIDTLFKKQSTRRFATFVSLFGVYCLSYLILICYQFKSPWYGPGFSPPSHYQRGPLMLDQGNNI